MPTLTTATDFRGGLSRLLNWLEDYPHIPVAYVAYADETGAELVAPAGLFNALTAAAEIADALNHPTIEITDPQHRRITWITITGTVADREAAPLDITVECSVYDQARAALLASLGVPAVPNLRVWTVTTEHLRSIVKARCA